nr:ethanolamine ammonia-lyase reactivating factor EutA [uncultured Holophaga sp.]
MKTGDALYSIGVDVGTTTTQVVFSRLQLARSGGYGAIPTVRIARRELIHRGTIRFTPLQTPEQVDGPRLREIVEAEYRACGIAPSLVKTGAVIITGESARKENAREVAQQLADLAGDFVVCTAGPDYEGILAGRGAGAAELSRSLTGRLANFDIGGGTTNVAVFENGEVVDTYAADLGGRLVRIDGNGCISYISERLVPLIRHLGLDLKPGAPADRQQLGLLSDAMAACFTALMGLVALDDLTRCLLIDHPPLGLEIRHTMFSGGVAEFIFAEGETDTDTDPFRFGDMGPLLGESLRRLLPTLPIRVHAPAERIRATVVGAGSHAVRVSGNTVTLDECLLPLKSLPVVRAHYAGEPGRLVEELTRLLRRHDNRDLEPSAAVHLTGLQDLDYTGLKTLAGALAATLANRAASPTQVPAVPPFVLLTEGDCAKSLGLLVRQALPFPMRLICLDRVEVQEGDYLDIGHPMGGVVPVIVKTLLFHSGPP